MKKTNYPSKLELEAIKQSIATINQINKERKHPLGYGTLASLSLSYYNNTAYLTLFGENDDGVIGKLDVEGNKLRFEKSDNNYVAILIKKISDYKEKLEK